MILAPLSIAAILGVRGRSVWTTTIFHLLGTAVGLAWLHWTLWQLGYGGTTLAGVAHAALGWLFATTYRCKLLVFWAVLVPVAVGAVAQARQGRWIGHLVSRKLFHVLLVMIALPPVLADVDFARITLAGALCAFLLLETARVYRVRGLGTAYQRYCAIFADSRDVGPLLLTPLYLLVGCALPVFLGGPPTAAMAGLLALGIGDAVAAIVGRCAGRHPWFDSCKTLEGSSASLLAQAVLVAVVGRLSAMGWLRCVAGLSATVVLEATTEQIDNAVVPLHAYALLCMAGSL